MASNPTLTEILELFKKKKILIIGDVMVDEYLWGKVSRISPEAPVPVVSCSQREHRMGGAANVAINIKALGAEPVMCSIIGDDEVGKIFSSLIEKRSMTKMGIISSSKRVTTVKTRVIGNSQQLLRVDQEITDFLDSDLEDQLKKKIIDILDSESIDAIIFQDYDKGILTSGIIESTVIEAQKREIPNLVDPKKRSFLNYHGVTLFKPNFKELTEGLNLHIGKTDKEGLLKAAKKLQNEKSIKQVMVTLSEKGVFVASETDCKILPAEERDIADVSGAGDTVIAVVTLALASNIDIFQAARLANKAGGLVCEKVGVVPITPELLLKDDLS